MWVRYHDTVTMTAALQTSIRTHIASGYTSVFWTVKIEPRHSKSQDFHVKSEDSGVQHMLNCNLAVMVFFFCPSPPVKVVRMVCYNRQGKFCLGKGVHLDLNI